MIFAKITPFSDLLQMRETEIFFGVMFQNGVIDYEVGFETY